MILRNSTLLTYIPLFLWKRYWITLESNYVPILNWILKHKGVKRLEIGGEDKRQLTAVLTCTMSGKLSNTSCIRWYNTTLPVKDIPPANWNLSFTKNQWSNEELMMMYFHTILLAYVQKRSNLKLGRIIQL